MQNMIKKSVTDEEKEYIKEECLIGIEHQPSMYALAASNMILRGDGKANLYQGSCFEETIFEEIKKRECNVGMLNPPYAQGDADLHELVFIKQMLDALVEGGIGIAIVPMSCAISPHPFREEILSQHTLEAVMSMPDDLFYPVGTVTCIMVFTAGIPHKITDKKTWFGYWKNDGFVKTKLNGRCDAKNTWHSIRDIWIEQYKNREVHPGKSVMQKVSHDDEWCAEAYLETDYDTITEFEFEQTVKNYAISKMLCSVNSNNENQEAE